MCAFGKIILFQYPLFCNFFVARHEFVIIWWGQSNKSIAQIILAPNSLTRGKWSYLMKPIKKSLVSLLFVPVNVELHFIVNAKKLYFSKQVNCHYCIRHQFYSEIICKFIPTNNIFKKLFNQFSNILNSKQRNQNRF